MTNDEKMKNRIKTEIEATKRKLILQEVSKLFETHGLSDLKMQDIAAHLGMSVGALYKLFTSKEALYYAYVAYQFDLFYRRWKEGCADDAAPEACLARFVALKLETFRSKRKAVEDPMAGDPLFFLKMSARIDDAATPVWEFLAYQFEKLDARSPLKEKDHLKTAYLFSAFTNGYVEYWITRGGTLEESPEEVVAAFLNGMADGMEPNESSGLQ